ncbi:MAG: hypothetical protein K0R58_834 [Ramlibacter sp.]|nr:hypothetical protein [Ramlibacter sp.]
MSKFPERAARWRAGATRCCAVGLLLALGACGGGSEDAAEAARASSTGAAVDTVGRPGSGAAPTLAPNEVKITVDGGTDGSAVNSPFVEVTLCAPGGGQCTTIDHVLLDTGSSGLRIAASALGSQLRELPAVRAADGNTLAECAGFVSGYTWGSVRTAQVRMASEIAEDVPVQVIGDPGAAYGRVPEDCSGTGPDLGEALGVNGILGVGFLNQDCGADCVTGTAPGMYFSCTTARCDPTAAPLASQVANPVSRFATHNNGVAIRLPAVAVGGVERLEGTLFLGIGTASNNRVEAEQVFTAGEGGNLTTTYRGRTMRGFLDSGSNGIFFRDRSIADCTGGFYCPPRALSLSASVSGSDGKAKRKVDFAVESASTLPDAAVAAHLGGDLGGGSFFVWGLPFFFGRTVFVAFSNARTPHGTGPYWAF